MTSEIKNQLKIDFENENEMNIAYKKLKDYGYKIFK